MATNDFKEESNGLSENLGASNSEGLQENVNVQDNGQMTGNDNAIQNLQDDTGANEEKPQKKGLKKLKEDHPDYIPKKEKIAYGIGAFMDGGGVALIGCVMLRYMTNTMKIAAVTASLIIMLSKAWDAISDPLMGVISDNTRSRWGRRRPYMFGGGFLLILAMALLFLPSSHNIGSQSGRVAYILVMFLFWNTASTITQVPYCSLASDISPDYSERDRANTVKLICTSISAGISYLGPLLALEALEAGKISSTGFWAILTFVFGVLFGGGLIVAAIFTKERVKPVNPEIKAKFNFKVYIDCMKNKSFRWHIIMYASAFMCMDVLSAFAVYYANDVWGGTTLFGMNFSSMFVIAPLMVGAVIMIPVCRYVLGIKSKQFAFRMGLPAYILGGILLGVLSPEWAPTWIIPIISLMMGLGFGGAQTMPWIIFPDTIDVAELKTGKHPTGAYSGMMTFVRKLSGALAIFIAGIALEAFGYQASELGQEIAQTATAQLGIRIIMSLTVAILISIALIASLRYKVTSAKLERVKYFNNLRRENVSDDELSEEERAEKAALIDELYGTSHKEKAKAKA